MFDQEDEELKKLREEWPILSKDDKIDKFLWKMVWYHHTKHVPGSPAKPIWDLVKVIEKANESSDHLTKSIRTATWVGGLATAAGVITAIILHFV